MIGIIPIDKMHGRLRLSTLKYFIHDALHLGKFWEPLLAVVKQFSIESGEYDL